MAEKITLPEWFKDARGGPCETGFEAVSAGFIEKNLKSIASFMREALDPEGAGRKGALQAVEPKARISGTLILVAATSFSVNAGMLAGMAFIIACLTALSGIRPGALFKRVFPTFIFTSVLAVPALFSFISPGTDIFGFTVNGLKISVTVEGVKTALFFVSRAALMVSLAALLLLTTRQADFFKGLRELPIPSFFVTALFLTFRYVFILLKVAEDANYARKSRMISGAGVRESQDWFASRTALILKRSFNTAEEVNMAMASRGFDGKVRTFGGNMLAGRDYLWLGFTSFIFFFFLAAYLNL